MAKVRTSTLVSARVADARGSQPSLSGAVLDPAGGRKLLWVVGLAALPAWLTCGLLIWQISVTTPPAVNSSTPARGDVPAAAPTGSPTPSSRKLAARPGTERPTGPWGRLELTPITIEPPLEFIEERYTSLASDRWHFAGMDTEGLSKFLEGAGLSSSDIKELLATNETLPDGSGVVVKPTHDLVERLSSGTRGRIYHWLCTDERNLVQLNAFRFCSDSTSKWFAGSESLEKMRQLVDPFVYRNGAFLFFADLDKVFKQVPSFADRDQLVKVLSREQTFIAKLLVDEESDIEQLVQYWGRGGRAKDVRPILESLARVPGGQSIDIVHLLPSFARQRIYTYPRPSTDPSSRNRDCHWTALNFFNSQPDDRYADAAIAAAAIEERYFPIYANLQMGDLVMFVENDREVFHTAVYLADDILYTKNGSRFSRPWMLVHLAHMQDFYPRHGSVQIRYYRAKELD